MRVVVSTRDVSTQIVEALDLVARCRADDTAVRAEVLYDQWYARPRASFAVPPGCPPDLVEALRAAHFGFLHWEDGWSVKNVGSRGQAMVCRGGEARLLELADYAAQTRRGLLARPGDVVSVACRRDRVDPGDGWWRTSGPAWTWAAAPPGIVRLYFNCHLSGLHVIVSALTRLLADEYEPWLLKCAVDPAQYARNDVIIAYLMPATIERHATRIVELVSSGAVEGRRDGPPLTLRVVPGLAAAFDPGGNESFGVHRCRLVAEAAEGGLPAVFARFAAEGIDPERPWARQGDGSLPWEH